MTDVAKLQLIEAHYTGTLNETEQAEFDQLLASEAGFAEEVEDYDFLLAGFDMLHLENFEGQMRSWEQKHQEQSVESTAKVLAIQPEVTEIKKKGKFNLQRYIAIAAAIAAVAFMPLAYNLFFATPDVFDQMYHTPMAMASEVRGNALDEKERDRSDAFNVYNGKTGKKDFAKSAALLSAFVDKYGNQEYEALFYLGISQMELKEYQKASYHFEHIMESDTGFYAQSAQWMLALAQYKLGNVEVAKKFAKQIAANNEHNYQTKATKFLELVK